MRGGKGRQWRGGNIAVGNGLEGLQGSMAG